MKFLVRFKLPLCLKHVDDCKMIWSKPTFNNDRASRIRDLTLPLARQPFNRSMWNDN